jgi:hypothetical protein
LIELRLLASSSRISFFYGIVITMYFYDHEPPHSHAQYAEHHAVITIETGACSLKSYRVVRSSL